MDEVIIPHLICIRYKSINTAVCLLHPWISLQQRPGSELSEVNLAKLSAPYLS